MPREIKEKTNITIETLRLLQEEMNRIEKQLDGKPVSDYTSDDKSCYRRRQEILSMLGNYDLVEYSNENENAAFLGDVVTISVMYPGEELTEESFCLQELISTIEPVSLECPSISIHCPIGKALFGSSVGDHLNVRIPNGVITIDVLDIKKPRER